MFNWFWRLLYGLAKTIFYCIDFILSFSQRLAGIEPVIVEGEEAQLATYFLMSNEIQTIFQLISIIGVMLVFLFSAFAVIRSISKFGEDKTPVGVLGQVAKTLFYLLLVPVVMIVGGEFITAVMTAVCRATMGENATLGRAIFALVAEEAYVGDATQYTSVMDSFRSGARDYYSTGTVEEFFKLSEINYFLAYVAGIAVLVQLVKPMLTFVERIVSLVILFVCAPLSVSTSVLDDGARFKLWRDQVLNKFLTAYGALIAVNLFAVLLAVLDDVVFFPDSSFKDGLARLVFVLGGAVATNMGVVLFGNLVNNGAGSQFAADAAHLSSPLRRAGALMMGKMISPIAHKAGELGKKTGKAIRDKALRSRPAKAAGRAASKVGHKLTDPIRRGVRNVGHSAKELVGGAAHSAVNRAYGAGLRLQRSAKWAGHQVVDRARNAKTAVGDYFRSRSGDDGKKRENAQSILSSASAARKKDK